MSSIDNRERLVLVATGFNLLFEYSLRGINGFLLQPLRVADLIHCLCQVLHDS